MTVRDLFGLQIEATRIREGAIRALGLSLDGSDPQLVATFQSLLGAAITAEQEVLSATRRGKVIPLKARRGR